MRFFGIRSYHSVQHNIMNTYTVTDNKSEVNLPTQQHNNYGDLHAFVLLDYP